MAWYYLTKSVSFFETSFEHDFGIKEYTPQQVNKFISQIK